jgi:hypothetical protein
MNTVLWDVTPCRVVEWYQRLGGTCCLHLEGRGLHFYPEYRGSRFLQNVGTIVKPALVCYNDVRPYENHDLNI